ncbi:hypothetical protein [Cupriavidus sp. TMH.W2]|uniref:hypothetical protein n=1 Tax=Cupriavidus sp. TMH.W2 TaxID=3434465 RepID=UPI003D773BCB
MGKREVIDLTEAWWVWVGEQPAVRVASAREARALMQREGRDCEQGNRFNRPDIACPVAELLWNEPLPQNATFHRTVCSPVSLVLRRGQLRKVVSRLAPSKFERTARGWYALEPRVPAWWPRQYLDAVDDPGTLVLRGAAPWIAQLDARWPQP